jgi:stage III sporulation protein AG
MFKGLSGFFTKKKGKDGNPKPSPFENLVIIVIIGAIIIIAASFLSQPDTKDTMNEVSSISSMEDNLLHDSMNGQEIISALEMRMSELLSKVEGAGEVDVMIFADSSSEQVPAYNNEQDTRSDEGSNGKSSMISETRELALSGNQTPVILKVIVPQIKGVVVVAQGADDILIREQMNNAVCTLLGIPEHRVQILKHK